MSSALYKSKMQFKVLVLTETILPEWPSIQWIEKTRPTLKELQDVVAMQKPILIVSICEKDDFSHLFQVPFHICRLWCHFTTWDDFPKSEAHFLSLYVKNHMDHPLDASSPLISVVSTSYHSGNRILRPYHSLLAQTYDHWEWIVWDDSKDEATYLELLTFAKVDPRIRVFKAPHHSGFIGEMKQWSASLARGKWIVELDHDDIIAPQLLEWIVDIGQKHPLTGFIYSDYVELYENTEDPFRYGDFYACGFGSYVKQYVRGKYHNVAQTPPINPITLSHIVGVPNHVRVWKTSVYEAVGKHHHSLPVVDDYDLLLRTFLHTQKWVRIVSPAYFQYRNTGGNNFTFLRNDLIQKLVPLLYSQYLPSLREMYTSLGWENANDALSWNSKLQPVWELGEHSPKFDPPIETFYVPEDQDTENPCISIVLLEHETPHVKDAIGLVLAQTYQNWILFVIGVQSPVLEETMQAFQDSRIRYENLSRQGNPSDAKEYAMIMLVKTRKCLMFGLKDHDWTDVSYLHSQNSQ